MTTSTKTAKKRRSGNGSRHTIALMIRCTDAQRKRFDRQAEANGLSTSTWARMVLVREVTGMEARK